MRHFVKENNDRGFMLVLGIESSCDETAAAVVDNGRQILSNVIASQIGEHSKYGGVVPEIASRKHMEAVVPVILQALTVAGTTLRDIDGIAVTRGPGLIGSLLVGLSLAKALAFARGIPFVGVNHLKGHVAAVFLTERPPAFPFVALVVSGGHTNVYLVRNLQDFDILGQTRDDAAGEAFDKAAKLLNIGYPGGVAIDRMAKNGDRSRMNFPRAMKDSPDFSFSGVKTSLLTVLKKQGRPFSEAELPHVAAGYQEAIVEEKTLAAAMKADVSRVVVCGGVAANSRLREKFSEEGCRRGLDIFIPPMVLCTDNAAMIAVAGTYLLKQGQRGAWDMNAVSRWPLDAETV
jgi:N6-L-threonylcarbamoyladenine synthase